jgi:hypothetical protein
MTSARRIASGADFVVTTSRASPATVMLASTVAICICTSSRGLLPIFGASGVSKTTLRKSWSPAVIRVAPDRQRRNQIRAAGFGGRGATLPGVYV